MVLSFLGGRKDGAARPPRGPAELRAYWEGLRRNGDIPCRSDLDPRGMADILDRVFVGESIANGVIRLRIAGMGLAELAGTDMKGMPLTAIFLPEARSRLTEALELVVTSHAVVEMHLQAEQSIGRPALDGRLLLLPLRPAKEGTTLVLGCLATEGKIGRAPRRFGITHLVTERTTPHLPQEQMTAPMAFAEPWVPPLAGKGLPARPLPARPHLRLVHSAD